MSHSGIKPWSAVDGVLRENWNTLVDRLALNPTLKPAWIEIVARTLRGAGQEPSVFVDRDAGGDLAAVVPFYATRTRMAGLGMRVLQLASNLVSYHAELVSSVERREVLRRWLTAAPRWDVVHFANLDTDGPTAAAVAEFARESGASLQIINGDLSPFLPVAGTWEAYLASKKKKFRYKLRHRRELLDEHGKWELRWFESEADTERLLSDVVHIEKRSWKAKEGIDIPSDPRELQYHREVLPFLARQGMLIANVAYIADQPAAYCLCCRDGTWIGNMKTSFDESFAALSPGAVVIDTCIERAFGLGAREFDFLGNPGAHKLAWSALTRAHADYFLFAPRLKARLVFGLKNLKRRFAARPPAPPAESTDAE